MKTVLALIAFVALCNIAIAQKEHTTKSKEATKRKGYIGFTLGPSFPIGSFKEYGGAQSTDKESTSAGLQLNLLSIGYLFSDHVGIAGNWYGSANPRSNGYDNSLQPWSFGGLMAGPLVSFPIANKVEWDFRLLLGYSVSSGTIPGWSSQSDVETARAFAFSLGTTFRINMGKRIALLLPMDYFSSNPEFEVYGGRNGSYTLKIKTLSLGVGFAYRLK